MKAPPVLVLHIEDDDAVRTSLAALLGSEGYRTVSAIDGTDAVTMVKTAGVRPDVLIVDYALPGDMDGTDTVQEICGFLGRAIPTIVLSGELANAAVPWLPGAPLFCVWKPLDPEVLLTVVGSFAALGSFLGSRDRQRK